MMTNALGPVNGTFARHRLEQHDALGKAPFLITIHEAACRSSRGGKAIKRALERLISRFAVADANRFFDFQEENLAIPNLSRASGLDHCLDSLVGKAVRQDHLYLKFGQQIDRVLVAPVDLRVSFLAAVSSHFTYRQAFHSDLV